MKIIKSCFKNYLTLLLALLLAGIITLIACKPEVPLGAPRRGLIWNPLQGLELWAENSSGGGDMAFYIDTSGRMRAVTIYSGNLTGVTIVGENVTGSNITSLTSAIGRSATIYLANRGTGLATANSTAAEQRQADYLCDNSTNTLAKWALAIAALPAAGGSIEFASGNYVSSNNLTVSVPGTTVRGQGYNTIATMNATGAVFFNTANNTTFRDLRTDIGGITSRLNVDTPRLVNVWIGSTYYENTSSGAVTNTGTSTLTTGVIAAANVTALTGNSAIMSSGNFTNFHATDIFGIASGSVNMTQGLYYVQVTHGLSAKPIHVFLTLESMPNAAAAHLWWATANATSTEFQILTADNSTALAIMQIGWLAVIANY